MRSAATAMVLGASLVQLVPWSVHTVRAAWCWPTGPPVCVVPATSNGGCFKDGAAVTTLNPGENCTPSCDAGYNISGSCTTLACPISTPGSNNQCRDDLSGPWWDYCGWGDSCVGGVWTMDSSQTFGFFSCVADGSPGICGAIEAAPTGTAGGAANNDLEVIDHGTIGLVGGLFVIALMGMFFAFCCTGSCARVWFRPGAKQWSPANAAGMLVVFGILLGAFFLPLTYKVSGVAAGLGTALTLVWSFFKLGAHDVMRMTREAAWRVHAAIGFLTLVVSIVHGIMATRQFGEQVVTTWHFLLGLIGTVLMIFGVLPAHLVHYDKFKLLHMLSFLGYLLCLVHMIGHAYYMQTIAAILMAGVNGLALVLFFVQKIYVKASAGSVQMKSLELTPETAGKHLFLNMKVDGFKFQAGQWGHLSVPSISAVPHPFTLVPGPEGDQDCNVRIFMKINRSGFTKKLADACEGGSAPPMKLEGPHGTPCVPSKGIQRTVFVFGGVGITPALSLAKAAHEASGRKVALYWSLRSLELLKRCEEHLKDHLEMQQSCIQLNGAGMQEGGQNLPLEAKYAMKDLSEWLKSVGEVYVKEGVTEAMVFVCGPPQLAEAAKAAAQQRLGGIAWHMHVEEFLFLPSMSFGAKRPPTAPTPEPKA